MTISLDRRAELAVRAAVLLRRYARLPREQRKHVWKLAAQHTAARVSGDAATDWDLQLANWLATKDEAAASLAEQWDLDVANVLDSAYNAAADGADQAVLDAANALDRMEQAVRDSLPSAADVVFPLVMLGAGAFGAWMLFGRRQ
jgi:hypothetical protein